MKHLLVLQQQMMARQLPWLCVIRQSSVITHVKALIKTARVARSSIFLSIQVCLKIGTRFHLSVKIMGNLTITMTAKSSKSVIRLLTVIS